MTRKKSQVRGGPAGWTTELGQGNDRCGYTLPGYDCWRKQPEHLGSHYDQDKHEWFGLSADGKTVVSAPAGRDPQ